MTLHIAPEGVPAPSDPTVAQIVTEYLAAKADQVHASLISAGALEKARFYTEAFAQDFGHLPVSLCRKGDLKRFLTKHPEYVSPFTKHDAVGHVVTAFRWAEDDGLIARCPYNRPRDLPTPEPRSPISAVEVQRVLLAAKTRGYQSSRVRFRMALWFLWETGCRTCELRRIAWTHYDRERGVFELRSKTTSATGRKRLIVLTARAWRLIRWMARHNPSGAVFLNGRGRPWTKESFGSLFRLNADHAGIRPEVSAYSLRHGFCCSRLEAGVGERQIADLMGHSSTRYVSWYGRGVRTNIDYLRDAAEKRKE